MTSFSKAYDSSATPKEVDPFIVTVFSPKSRLGAELIGMIRQTRIGKGPLSDPDARPMLFLGMMDYATTPQWVIRSREPRSTRFDDKRHFAAFQRNIERLAA